MRRSFDKAAEQSNLNIVTAFVRGARLSPGITQCAIGSSEILALRELIEMLDIHGNTITADALHCQRETCELIVQEGGDYCLQLKGNQGDMLADVGAFYTIKTLIIFMNTAFLRWAWPHEMEERSYRGYDVPDYSVEIHQWA